MSREELIAWLRLLSLEFSANKLRALLERFGSALCVLAASAEELAEVPYLRKDVAERIAAAGGRARKRHAHAPGWGAPAGDSAGP